MFTVKIGPTTTDIESPLIEQAAVTTHRTAHEVLSVAQSVDRLLRLVERQPRIVFRIGPISSQE